MLRQIARQRRDEPRPRHLSLSNRIRYGCGTERAANRDNQLVEQRFDVTGTYRKTMVRAGTRDAERRFHHIQAIHPKRRRLGASPLGELSRITQMHRLAREEIGIHGEDHVGRAQVVLRHERRGARAIRLASRLRRERRVEMHAGRGIQLREFLQQLGFERRRRGRKQQPQPLTSATGALPQLLRRELSHEVRPPRKRPAVPQALGAVRIVQLQHGRLLEDPGCAETRGMIRISLDLRGTPLVTLDQQSGRVAVEHHRRRVVLRHSRRQIRLIHVRQDSFGRQTRAAFESSERHARAEQLHEVAPRQLVGLQRVQVRFQGFPPVVHCEITCGT